MIRNVYLSYFLSLVLQLPCGHQCKAICHPGLCPNPKRCVEKVKLRCQCRRKKGDFVCNEVQSGLAKIECDEVCFSNKEKLQTGLHYFLQFWFPSLVQIEILVFSSTIIKSQLGFKTSVLLFSAAKGGGGSSEGGRGREAAAGGTGGIREEDARRSET